MFWDTFYNRCIERGTKPTPLCESLNITSAAVTKWKKSGAIPGGENLLKIAEALDCSIDYLLGRTDNPDVFHSVLLADDEALLLDRYSRLDNDRKEILRAWALELTLDLDRGSGNLGTKKPASDPADAGEMITG